MSQRLNASTSQRINASTSQRLNESTPQRNSHHLNQFHIEDEGAVGRNHFAGTVCTVSQF